MRWTEGHVHVAMRAFLRRTGWTLVAGEYPGGSDHELYPLCVVDPALARDASPDPRRHSLGELIPDLVAIRDRQLLIAEAKTKYSESDRVKLEYLLTERRADLIAALEKFSVERNVPELMPIGTLTFYPTLVFLAAASVPPVPPGISFLLIHSTSSANWEGPLATENGNNGQ